jgi:hypothetical protein
LEAIQWPDDDGTNPAKPCFTLPDGTYIGKIMAFVNVGWWEPEVQNEVKARTLYADRIITSSGEVLATQSAQTVNYITNITNIVATPSATPTPDVTPALDASTSALLSSLSQSVSVFTADNIDLSGRSLTIASATLHNNLSVLGTATLGETSIAGSLLVDASVRVSGNGIETITEPLYLNRSKFADVDILAGTLVVTTSGDVVVTGNLLIKGILGVSTIAPASDNLTISLKREKEGTASAFGKLIIKGIADKSVEIDEQGNIVASGSATVTRLNISDMSDSTSTKSAEATPSATIGTALLPAGQKGLFVETSAITEKSLIYITPISSTGNQVLYVKTKSTGSGFTIDIDTVIDRDIKFNWWIVN